MFNVNLFQGCNHGLVAPERVTHSNLSPKTIWSQKIAKNYPHAFYFQMFVTEIIVKESKLYLTWK